MNKFLISSLIIIALSVLPSEAYNTNKRIYAEHHLSQIEQNLFGTRNSNVDSYTRLARIEQQLFGTIQSGTFENRINFINRVINNSSRNMAIRNNNIKLNKIKNALREVFNGTVTGYTPPVHDPVNYYNYNATKFPQNRNFYGNSNFITQTRVIIDD